MKKYRVLFWFGVYTVNPFIKPSKEVIVETDRTNENEIKLLALRKLTEAYPRTYSALVKEIN